MVSQISQLLQKKMRKHCFILAVICCSNSPSVQVEIAHMLFPPWVCMMDLKASQLSFSSYNEIMRITYLFAKTHSVRLVRIGALGVLKLARRNHGKQFQRGGGVVLDYSVCHEL